MQRIIYTKVRATIVYLINVAINIAICCNNNIIHLYAHRAIVTANSVYIRLCCIVPHRHHVPALRGNHSSFSIYLGGWCSMLILSLIFLVTAVFHHSTPFLTAAPKTDLSSNQVSNADLSNHQVSNADFFNHQAPNADLSNYQTSNVDLSNHQASNADLSNHQASNADLSNHQASKAGLSNNQFVLP